MTSVMVCNAGNKEHDADVSSSETFAEVVRPQAFMSSMPVRVRVGHSALLRPGSAALAVGANPLGEQSKVGDFMRESKCSQSQVINGLTSSIVEALVLSKVNLSLF